MKVDLRAFEEEEDIIVAVLDHMGRKVFSSILASGKEHVISDLNKNGTLSAGFYYVVASGNVKMLQDNIVITNGDK